MFKNKDQFLYWWSGYVTAAKIVMLFNQASVVFDQTLSASSYPFYNFGLVEVLIMQIHKIFDIVTLT